MFLEFCKNEGRIEKETSPQKIKKFYYPNNRQNRQNQII